MPASGTWTLQLRLPSTPMDEPPTVAHEFKVLPASAMPSHLQILDIDFWDRLRSNLKWGSRTVACTSPSTGKKVQMPFEIGHEDANINHTRSCSFEEGVANEGTMLRLRHDIHLRPKEHNKVRMFAECTEARSDGVYSIHPMIPEGFVWEKEIVTIHEEEGPRVWHHMQNSSRTENVSFRDGRAVAKVIHHFNVNALLDSDYCGQEWPTFVNHLITEPLDRTKNNQTVSERPVGHLLRKPAHERCALTCERLKDKTELVGFDNWC